MNPVRGFEQHTPEIAPDAWLDPTCVVIGDVRIGARSSVWPCCVIRGDINRIRIGCDTNIQDGSILHNSHDGPHLPGGAPLLIGSRVTVGHKALLHGCEIADHCLIGMGAIIMDRSLVETNVIVGAGALVPPGKVLRSGYLYTGSPAREARPLSRDEKAYLGYSAEYYVELAGRHRQALGGSGDHR